MRLNEPLDAAVKLRKQREEHWARRAKDRLAEWLITQGSALLTPELIRPELEERLINEMKDASAIADAQAKVARLGAELEQERDKNRRLESACKQAVQIADEWSNECADKIEIAIRRAMENSNES